MPPPQCAPPDTDCTRRPPTSIHELLYPCRSEGVSRERNVVVDFPNVATARACYSSQEYQAAKAIRNAIAEPDFIIVEGT